jgi:hypothetical protein
MTKKTATSATSSLNSVLNFKFIVTLIIVEHYLKYAKDLSQLLQSVNCDLLKASKDSKSLFKLLQEKRENETCFKILFKKATDLATKLDVAIEMPRIIGRQCNRANVQTKDIEQHYMINLHHAFVDHLSSEIKRRLLDSFDRVDAELLLPKSLKSLTDEKWNAIKQTYSAFLGPEEDVDVELERWSCRLKDDQSARDLSLVDCYNESQFLYPNLHQIFSVLLTMPVSSASAERSFSALKRLKTYLRSTMGADRLCGLALMHIHRRRKIDIEKVLKRFDASGHRRIALLFD